MPDDVHPFCRLKPGAGTALGELLVQNDFFFLVSTYFLGLFGARRGLVGDALGDFFVFLLLFTELGELGWYLLCFRMPAGAFGSGVGLGTASG